MKKLVSILSFCILVLPSLSAQETYFHELKGLEDSTGTTHLFYRLYKTHIQPCTYVDYNQDTVHTDLSVFTNNIFHYNTPTQSASIRFHDGETVWADCYVRHEHLSGYAFFKNDPRKAFQLTRNDAAWLPPNLTDWRGNHIGLDWGVPDNIGIDYTKNEILIPTPLYPIVVKRKGGPQNLKSTIRASLDGTGWNQIEYYDSVPDSLLIDFSILAINPYHDGEYLGVQEDSLFRSLNHGDSLSFIFANDFFEDVSADVFFTADSSRYYFASRLGANPRYFDRIVWKLEKRDEEWFFDPIKPEWDIHGITNNSTGSDELYIADSTSVFISANNGLDFSPLFNTDFEITGLYKKPNSDLLYILTRQKLLEADIRTKSVKTLLEVPVSIDTEPIEIPTQITLHQNYPNPFNPTTHIPFELNQAGLVTLSVFDALGRKIQTLINSRQSAGAHSIQFDASELASGLYFYRLETAGKTFTQKMMLVK